MRSVGRCAGAGARARGTRIFARRRTTHARAGRRLPDFCAGTGEEEEEPSVHRPLRRTMTDCARFGLREKRSSRFSPLPRTRAGAVNGNWLIVVKVRCKAPSLLFGRSFIRPPFSFSVKFAHGIAVHPRRICYPFGGLGFSRENLIDRHDHDPYLNSLLEIENLCTRKGNFNSFSDPQTYQ